MDTATRAGTGRIVTPIMLLALVAVPCTACSPPDIGQMPRALDYEPLPASKDAGSSRLQPSRTLDGGATSTTKPADAGAFADDGGVAAPPASCVGSPAVEREPNDDAASATPIVEGICGAIDDDGDVDVFVFDAVGTSFLFEPEGDANITVTSPSGEIDSGEGPSTYVSAEVGRFTITVTSPSGQRQGYVIERLH